MRKSNKAKQTPSRTCADCFHFCACHQWVTSISTDVAPQCPAFETVRYRTLAELVDLRQMHKVDLAPVVRCKDCKFRGFDACPMCHDEYTYDEDDGGDYYTVDNTTDDGFCHMGAKMDGGAADG